MKKNQLILVYWFCFFLLVGVSFMPWAFYSDINKNFTGFYSHDNYYGKPAKLLILIIFLNGALLFFSKLWARFISLFLMSVAIAYSVRTYFLFSACANGICPSLKPGLYLMLTLVFAIFIISLYGKVKVKKY